MVCLQVSLLDVSHSFCCHRRTSCGLVVHHNLFSTSHTFIGFVAPCWENPLGKGVQARAVTVQASDAARASAYCHCHGISHVSYSPPWLRCETFLCNLLRNEDGDYMVGLYSYTFLSHFSFTEPSFHFGYLDICGFIFGFDFSSSPVQSISACNLQFSLTSSVLPCPAVWFKKYGEWMIKEQRMGEASNPGPFTLVLDELIRADEGIHSHRDSAEVVPESVPIDHSIADHSNES